MTESICTSCAAESVCPVEVSALDCSLHIPDEEAKEVVEMLASGAVHRIRALDNCEILGYIRDAERMRKSVRKSVLRAVEERLEEWEDVIVLTLDRSGT